MSAISGMNISMKNNNRRTKREAFSNISGESDKESQGIEIETVSEEALAEIRNKLQKQRKLTRRKNIVAICITILILFLLVWFLVYQIYYDPGVSWRAFSVVT